MARVTHVKKAQQRYATKPVIDPATGEQKQTPRYRTDREGNRVQMTDKRGRLLFMSVTERDTSKPLPLLRCGACGKDIEIGTPYKHVTPHGRSQMNRHADCPSWKQSELRSSRMAEIDDAADDFHGQDFDTADDVRAALEAFAEVVRDVAEGYRESAGNIEDGFGHATYQSEELNERADALEGWADEIEQTDIDDEPDEADHDTTCSTCGGTGQVENPDYEDDPEARDPEAENDTDETVDCDDCDGSGEAADIEDYDTAMDTWRSEVEDATSIVDECPA